MRSQLRFFAEIRRDPDGYVWEKLTPHGPGFAETSEHYPNSIVLRAKGHKAILDEYRKTGGVVRRHCYDPFIEEPALFRIFADLTPTKEAIIDFANKYGDITPFDDLVRDHCTTLGNWGVISGWYKEAIAKAEQFMARPVRDRRKYAKAVAEFIDPYLAQLAVYLKAVASDEAISLRAEPRGLIDVMTIQFVESVVERKTYRNCEQCNKPFEVTPQVNRSDRIFCSDNCRVKAYQRRKKQAIEMRDGGRKLREIATAVGSDMKTIKKWVDRKE